MKRYRPDFQAGADNTCDPSRRKGQIKIPACCWCNPRRCYTYLLGRVASAKRKRKAILRHRKLIGEAIRAYRKRVKLTQEELAERADLNPKYLGEVERGEKIISIEALMRIAKAVKVPVRHFFRSV